MFLLGQKDALPAEGTAWLVLPDGSTYQVEELKRGITAIPTVQVETGERLGGKKVFRVEPSGPARIRFEGTATLRGSVRVESFEPIRDEAVGPTRFIELE